MLSLHLNLFLFVFFVLNVVFCFPNSNTTTLRVNYADRVVDGETFPSYQISGEGPYWKDTGAGVWGLVIPQNDGMNLRVINNLKEETILHAHGLTPPSSLDGVPYFSSVPLFPNRSVYFNYDFDFSGTYFLHSHYGFQFGNGLVIPLIIQGDDPSYPLYQDLVEAIDTTILLEDLCPKASEAYEKKLQAAIDDSTATPVGGFNRAAGSNQFGDCSSWDTFLKLAYSFNQSGFEDPNGVLCSDVQPATDSDVLYSKFLANGKTYHQPTVVQIDSFDKPIRVRVIDAGGMTNFLIRFPFYVTMIAVDGHLIEPYIAQEFWISVAQRLDFLVQVPSNWQSKSFYVVPYSENSNHSIPAPVIFSTVPISPTQASEIGNSLNNGYASGMMNNLIDEAIHAFNPLPQAPVNQSLVLRLTGDNGFRGINGYSYRLPPTHPLPYVPNPNPILVTYGERVEVTIANRNPDGHPMHLHGHLFQIVAVNGKRVNGAVRDVAFVPGGCANVTIAFDASNPGIWAFHCHLEFHLAAGMLTSFEYTN